MATTPIETVRLMKRRSFRSPKIENKAKNGKMINQLARDPLDILPLEIWAVVFRNLTAASDLLSCAKVSPVWEAFLQHTHPWMSLAQTMQFLLPFLTTPTKLICRRICVPLTEVIDDNLSRQEPDVLRTKLINRETFHARVFEDRRNKTKFGFWNPSLWHSISIQGIQHVGDWRLRVLCCLVRRGKYVENCMLNLLTDEEDEPMRPLLEVLSYLPNLKKLIICSGSGKYRPPWKMVRCFFRNQKHVNLPPLKYLEELQLTSVYPPVAEKILERYKSQLEKYSFS